MLWFSLFFGSILFVGGLKQFESHLKIKDTSFLYLSYVKKLKKEICIMNYKMNIGGLKELIIEKIEEIGNRTLLNA